MIRLVAIDMDGTLLRPDGHISERNVRALKGLKAMGAEFLICTGRSYIDALEPLKEAGLRAPVPLQRRHSSGHVLSGMCCFPWRSLPMRE